MGIYRMMKKIAGVLLLFTWGCADLGSMTGNAFDFAEISNSIVKPPAKEVALEGGPEGVPSESEIKAAPVKDLETRVEAGNPYLKKIPALSQPAPPAALSEEGVLLNFDNADIYEVIQVIAEILDLSYIIDPQVKGLVNIRSGRKIPMDQLYSVFKKLLNINGLDIRSEGDYNYIYRPLAKSTPQKIYGSGQVGELRESPDLVIQVIPVMHLPAAEAKQLLEPYKSAQGSIDTLENPNTLFISDYESKVMDMMLILGKLDISPLSTLKIRMVRVDKAPLFDLRDELIEILSALKINKQGHDGVTVMSLERVNSLLLVSGNQELLDSATRWISELDAVPSEGRDNIYIYNVRNSVASELALLVTDLISNQPGVAAKSSPAKSATNAETGRGMDEGGQARRSTVPPPTPEPTPAVVKTGKGVGLKPGEVGAGLRFAGEPTLIPDDSRNIILLRALPPDYSRLVKLLERLDNMPRQVLIEVMVAEVSLTDSWSMGIEWALHQQGTIDGRTYTNHLVNNIENLAGSTTPANIGANAVGLTYTILNSAGEVAGVLNAIADNNDLSILSSPQVMVLNNETATVNVGEQVPIITSQVGDISAQTTVNQTIQYKDTGVILKVTPKINYDGIIILDINQQVSSASSNTLSGTESPVISNRELATKLAVRDGQTIFMGGLISNNVNYIDTGCLCSRTSPCWVGSSNIRRSKRTRPSFW
jgi:general secretion pathway protein D